jgi:Mce-associated membrane protein
MSVRASISRRRKATTVPVETDVGDDTAARPTTRPPADPAVPGAGADSDSDGPIELPDDIADAHQAPRAEDVTSSQRGKPSRPGRRTRFVRALSYGVLPGLAFLLAIGAGYLKWQDFSVRDSARAGIQSVQAATDSTAALLSYRPDTVEKDLGAARERLTGTFRDSYTSLTKDVVIPGAKQRQISASATVPAAALVSATQTHAVVLVFVNQTTVVGNDPPTDTASSVRVSLDKIGGRWLISDFTPI